MTLTGRGADVIIIDDPLKPDDAVSETQRKAANQWYDGTLYSRLNDKSKGVIIIIMQRLHEDDLVGHVLKQEGWELLSFPAIAEIEEEHVVETVFGARRFQRRIGAALHPARESIETLENIRQTIGGLPPEKWPSLKYGFYSREEDLKWAGSITSPKRSSPSFGRSRC